MSARVAAVLRGVAENANLLAAVITTALMPSPELEPQPTPEPEEPSESPAPNEPASAPLSVQKEKSKGKHTPRKTAHGYGVFVAGEQDCVVDGLPTMDAAWEQIEKL
jgi:hypothetical protein